MSSGDGIIFSRVIRGNSTVTEHPNRVGQSTDDLLTRLLVWPVNSPCQKLCKCPSNYRIK